jgi:methionyl-tRNA synthetase
MLDDGERQVVAVIAEHYNPEDLIGKKVVMVANLQPAKLMGEESNGMILAVDKEPEGLQIIIVDNSVKNGSRVK